MRRQSFVKQDCELAECQRKCRAKERELDCEVKDHRALSSMHAGEQLEIHRIR